MQMLCLHAINYQDGVAMHCNKQKTNKRNNNNEMKWTTQPNVCNDEMQKLTHLKTMVGHFINNLIEKEERRKKNSSCFVWYFIVSKCSSYYTSPYVRLQHNRTYALIMHPLFFSISKNDNELCAWIHVTRDERR